MALFSRRSVFGLVGGDLVRPGVEGGEALVQAPDPPVLQPEAALGGPLQEGAVVADDQGRGAAGAPAPPPAVSMAKMSRWLVGSSSSSTSGCSAKARARAARRASPPESPAVGRAGSRPKVCSAASASCGSARRRRWRSRAAVAPSIAGLLRHQRHPAAAGDDAVAAVGLGQAGQHPQQGRLAGAVAADQAGAHARLQRQVDAVEQHARPVGQAHVLQGDDRGARGSAVRPSCA